MISTYAQLQNGVVINIVLASSTDYFGPTFIWVALTNLYCQDGVSPIQIGCTYDGSNFYPAGN